MKPRTSDVYLRKAKENSNKTIMKPLKTIMKPMTYITRTNTRSNLSTPMTTSEGGGFTAPAAPPGKSFRFVRACERAGARAEPDDLRLPRAFCGGNVFFFVVFVSARLAFSLFDPKNAQSVSGLLFFLLCFNIVHVKTNALFTFLRVFVL